MEEKKTKTITNLNGMTSITMYLSSISPLKKRLVFGYAGIALLNYMTCSYNDSKETLLVWRTESTSPKEEWRLACGGSTRNLECNLWKSIIFPWTFITNAMPTIILLMNPKKNKNQ